MRDLREQNLTAVADTLWHPLIVMSVDGQVAYANPAATDQLGDVRAWIQRLMAARPDLAAVSAESPINLTCQRLAGHREWRVGAWALTERHVALALTPERALPRAGVIALSLHVTTQDARLALRVAQGHSNQQVAASLGVQVGTINTRLWRLYRKVGVRSRAQLAALVVSRSGLGSIFA